MSRRKKVLTFIFFFALGGTLSFLLDSHHVSQDVWVKVLVVCFLVGYPALALISLIRSRRPNFSLPPRLKIYRSAIVSNWVFAFVVFGVIGTLDWDLDSIGFRLAPIGFLLGWTMVILLGCVVIGAVFHWFVSRGWLPPERATTWLIPGTRLERIVCLLLLAPTIGFCEELIFRGYLLHAIPWWLDTRGMAWAFALSSVAFGLAHAHQGLTGILETTLLGLLFGIVAIRVGTLLPSMIAHAFYDAAVLIWIAPTLIGRRGSNPPLTNGRQLPELVE